MNPVTFTVNAEKKYQLITHFGASSCWWECTMGEDEEVLKLMDFLYSDQGLGLNLLRSNIGGSVKADRSDGPGDPNTNKARAPLSPLQEDGTYDITRNKGAWSLLNHTLKHCKITDYTLFMNSPPATMTKNGRTTGTPPKDGEVRTGNLRPDCYEAYAHYVADVTVLYVHAGIPVRYVSPVNEPQWDWDNEGQEGCHYNVDELIAFYRVLVPIFKEKRETDPLMKDVMLSLPETAQWWQEPYVHDFYRLMTEDPLFKGQVDHFAAHSYKTATGAREGFARLCESLGNPLPLHQTEWAPMHPHAGFYMDIALETAIVLHEDFNILHCDSWCWWTLFAGQGFSSGLVIYDQKNHHAELPKLYYIVKQHSLFLKNHRPVETSAPRFPEDFIGDAYLSDDGNELVLELINKGKEPLPIRFEGLPFTNGGRTIVTNNYRNYGELPDTKAEEGILLDGESLTTVIFHR